ncbi:MAG: hypothetical protein NXI24_24535 [bacterium]|nr:hypothetical protein [bacterium]
MEPQEKKSLWKLFLFDLKGFGSLILIGFGAQGIYDLYLRSPWQREPLQLFVDYPILPIGMFCAGVALFAIHTVMLLRKKNST